MSQSQSIRTNNNNNNNNNNNGGSQSVSLISRSQAKKVLEETINISKFGKKKKEESESEGEQEEEEEEHQSNIKYRSGLFQRVSFQLDDDKLRDRNNDDDDYDDDDDDDGGNYKGKKKCDEVDNLESEKNNFNKKVICICSFGETTYELLNGKKCSHFHLFLCNKCINC